MIASDRDTTKNLHVSIDKNPDKNFMKAVYGMWYAGFFPW